MDEILSSCCVRGWVSLVSLVIFGLLRVPDCVCLVRGEAGWAVLGEAVPCPAPDTPQALAELPVIA